MAVPKKLSKIVNKNLPSFEGCAICKIFSLNKGIKMVLIGTENEEDPIKFVNNINILDNIELSVGNRVLVAFLGGKIKNPVIIGKLK